VESGANHFVARAFEIVVAGNLLLFGFLTILLAIDGPRLRALIEFASVFSNSAGAAFAVGVMWLSLSFALGNAVEGFSRMIFHFRENYIMASRMGFHRVITTAELVKPPTGALHAFVPDVILARWIVRRTGLTRRAPEDLRPRWQVVARLLQQVFPAWTTDVYESLTGSPDADASGIEPFGHAVTDLNRRVRRVGQRADSIPPRIQYDLARSFLRITCPASAENVVSHIKRLRVERVLVVTATLALVGRLIDLARDLGVLGRPPIDLINAEVSPLVFDSIILGLAMALLYYANQSVGMRIVRMCETVELELDVNAGTLDERVARTP
jgi:hypothetical protein